jgi:hypothetical protein
VWGPIGLALAVPLTVVAAVLGEYVAALEPLAILLGDKPPLAGWITYYQRLLASDVDEAARILAENHKTNSHLAACDNIVVPALVRAEKDREAGELLEPEQAFVWQATRELLEEWENSQQPALVSDTAQAEEAHPLRTRIIACPAHDAADEMALLMLRQGLTLDAHASFEILPATMLASEMLSAIAAEQPDGVCISSLGLFGGRHARYLCKRIIQSFPDLPILVGRWGYAGDRTEMTNNMKQRGADRVVTSLVEAQDALERMAPVVRDVKPVLAPTMAAVQPRVASEPVRAAS